MNAVRADKATTHDDPSIIDFPTQTFRDEGLLHYVNREFFWPLGMALTVRVVGEAERIDPLVDVLLDGLVDSAVASIAGDNPATDPFELITTRALTDFKQALRDELRRRLLAQSGNVQPGLAIEQTDPPEAIVSGLAFKERSALAARALRWIVARKRLVKQ